ncbi:exopolyphosphatase [Cognatilysobacter lacus]|uniref:Exopolyphosphatase n=1 Tax=Cognatilysobacter lacus TaxID=1643323 RepID=A0A5D8ZGC7_9GAMM|nr:exopolyphosphatase [Lysobacter lacus]TZF91724.1 exopolyphosphatase [Lysobacter lacus]
MNGLLHSARLPLKDGDQLAAVDLGSNSFHMVVASYVLGQLRIVDRIKETVRLAEGLEKGALTPPARERALECLERFGQRLRDIPPQHIRAIATNTVRRLATPQAFLGPAESALAHPIEVVSGREEARLIYLGVAHEQPPKAGHLRLVIDIGGGSTEFIIGSGFEAIERESVQVGAIATTRRFFADGKLSRKQWKSGVAAVSAELQQFAGTYRSLGWDEALGSSGTARAIGEMCAAMKLTKGAITAEALPKVRDRLLEFERIDAIALPGLSEDRQSIIAGGLLVMEAAFDALGLQRLAVSKAAMREGILYDMLGRGGLDDPREASVLALTERYGIDRAQAQRVEQTALRLFDQVAVEGALDGDDRLMLARAARLHELGLTIAHSKYHLHGAYIVENSDIAGFSQQQQQFLAALIRTHRRRARKTDFDALPDRLLAAARHIAALLRVAVVLHRGHDGEPIPQLSARMQGERLTVSLDSRWLERRPLLKADLRTEQGYFEGLDMELVVETT